ncbi:hypothetical protein N7454_002352 [Penicillium verhagenii]|nr:hypothetical protein N7454_002352 [Penicillium verhagenii]
MSKEEEVRRLEEESHHEETDVMDEFESPSQLPPPTYDSLYSDSLASPILENDMTQLATFEDNGRFSIDLQAGSRTSAIVQTFVVPITRPKVIRTDENSALESPVENLTLLSPVTTVTPATPVEKTKRGISLDIVLMLVGSRDEIKSCIAIAQELQEQGHRARVVTHSIFKSLIMSLGLEFFSISSDPDHPIAKRDSGLMPGLRSAKRAEVLKSKEFLRDTLQASWIACTHPGSWEERPFLADAIIATPLAHAHIHCAERLSIPLHIMSTTPWTPTEEFAHTLAQIQKDEGSQPGVQNYISHMLIGESVWQDTYTMVDNFRQHTLGLSQIPLVGGGELLQQLDVPHTYLWSSSLVPKPEDWDDNNDISGYAWLDEPSLFQPSDELQQFLESAVAPVYVAIDISSLGNSEKFVRCLRQASIDYGLSFLLPSSFHPVSGIAETNKIFVCHNVPLDWIVPRIEILLTHGDAHTASIGLRYGKPMISLPVLGDQPFWSEAIFKAGVGSAPLNERNLSSELIVTAFRFCLQKETREKTTLAQNHILSENGTSNAVESFHRHVRSNEMICSIIRTDLATYCVRQRPSVQISSIAAALLIKLNKIRLSELDTIQRRTYISQKPHGGEAIEKGSKLDLVTVKSVGMGIIKAIAKPTVSHIADACSPKPLSTVEKAPLEGSKMVSKLAKQVGFTSAVFIGKIAILPFKTVYYMSETATYGVRACKGPQSREVKEQTIKPKQIEEISIPAADPMSRSTIDCQQLDSLGNLKLERGRRDKRAQDPRFVEMVISEFEGLCSSMSSSSAPPSLQSTEYYGFK